MPSASREIRKKRRIKRNLTLATRAYRAEALNRLKVQTILLTVLAANNGEIYVTEAGIQSTAGNLGKIGYVVEKAEYDKDGQPAPEGLFIVKLVTGEPTATAQAFPSTVEQPSEARVGQ